MFDVTVELISRMRLDYGMPLPEPDVLQAQARSWCEHFRENGIPAAALNGLYSKAIKVKNNGFMPTLGDLLAAWNSSINADYHAEVTYRPLRALPPRSNDGERGFLVLSYNHARHKAGMPPVKCNCGEFAALSADKKYFCCEKAQCGFRGAVADLVPEMPVKKPMPPRAPAVGNLGGALDSIAGTMQPSADRSAGDLDDDYLLELLKERCKMNVKNAERALLLEFGRYLEQRQPILTKWDLGMARRHWAAFMAARE